MKNGQIISGPEIQNLIDHTTCLKDRTIATMRTQLHGLKAKLNTSETDHSFSQKKNTIPTSIYRIFQKTFNQK